MGKKQFGPWLRAELDRPARKVSASSGVFAQADVLSSRPVMEIPSPCPSPNVSVGRSAREGAKPPVESAHKLDVDTSDLATEKFEKTLHEIDTELGSNPDGMDASLECISRDKCDLKEADPVDGLRNLSKLGPIPSKVDIELSFKAENGPIETKEPLRPHVALTSKSRSPLVDITNRSGPSRVSKVLAQARWPKVTRKPIPTPSNDVLLKFIRKRPSLEASDPQPSKRRTILSHEVSSPVSTLAVAASQPRRQL